jgi:DNA-binding helix-hairpin-helix protein with protein kinase domain/Tfp pilus assembly protein PilF
MPKFYDSKGNTHELAEEIGRGGEGTVYSCVGNTELVAKIYYEPITDEKAKKLRLMAENKNKRLLKVAAWVVDTLHDKPNGRTIGFLMPNIKAKEIHELYSLKSRRVHFPQATWHYLIHTATNLARAFYSLHKYSHVIGDVNHGNCVVLADGTVKLIDCDSYAISDGEKRFPCKVGVATHLAPELQKANLSEVERKPEHDNFALAVVIFQLLFLGRHPFSGNYLGDKDKSLEECIAEFRFAYGQKAESRSVKQPPGTLNLREVPPRIAELFERAFDSDKDRPNPREWIEALVDLSNNLAQCGLNPGHRFYSSLDTCPWCRIESQTGLMLFPFVFSEEETDGERPFNIFTVEKLIENLGNQRNLPAKIEKPISLVKPEPLPEIVQSASFYRNNQILYVGGYFVGLVVLNLIFGIVLGTLMAGGLMVFLFFMVSKESKEMQSDLLDSLNEAERKWTELEREWTITASPKMFAGDIKSIKQRVADYKNFQVSTRRELKALERSHNEREFVNYLSSFRLQKNKIDGVSDEIRQKLIKNRIWTAADIDKEELRTKHGVNLFVQNKLVEWREDLEKNYVPKDNTKEIKQKKERFLKQQGEKRRKIERAIETSLENLRKGSLQAQENQKLLVPKSEDIARQISQCRSNLEAVGDTSIALASLVLVTVLVPFFGGIISQMNSSGTGNPNPPAVYRQRPESGGTFESAPGGGTGFGDALIKSSGNDEFIYAYESLTMKESENLDVPDPKIRDEEISVLTDSKRRIYSDNLIRQAIKLIKDFDNSVNQADKKARLAMRIEPENIRAFEEYGKALFEKKLYNKSLEVFSKLELEEESKSEIEKNPVVRYYLGVNFLELKRFTDARNVLLKAVRYNASTENYYKLGLAYNGLKDYPKALKSFEYAIQMASKNVDAHYELGYVHFKLNDKEAFNQQYSKLLDLDPEKAAELLKNSYKLPPKEVKNINKGPLKKLSEDTTGFSTGPGNGFGTGSGREN